jgi:hypothetical protein
MGRVCRRKGVKMDACRSLVGEPEGKMPLGSSRKLRGLSPLANYTDRATSRLLAKLVPTFADTECHVASVTDPYCCILDFLDRNRYFFFQVASQLYSRGWVDPVPDPLLLRKSGNDWNRNPDLWICSQELWSLDRRNGAKTNNRLRYFDDLLNDKFEAFQREGRPCYTITRCKLLVSRIILQVKQQRGTDSVPCHYFVVRLNYWEQDAEEVNNYVICWGYD